MDTALPQKFPFISDMNLAKVNCAENRVCTSCDTVGSPWSVHNSPQITPNISVTH